MSDVTILAEFGDSELSKLHMTTLPDDMGRPATRDRIMAYIVDHIRSAIGLPASDEITFNKPFITAWKNGNFGEKKTVPINFFRDETEHQCFVQLEFHDSIELQAAAA